MNDEQRRQETYLGDGLYASFDGFMIVLRAPRLAGDHWVGLEPPQLDALISYMRQCGYKIKTPSQG